MKSIIYLFIILLFFTSCEQQKFETRDNNFINVDSDIIVSKNDTLIISKGTTYIFHDTSKIIVEGNIFVNGTHDEPVVFKPADSLSGWGGILLKNDFKTGKATIKNSILKNGRIYSKNFKILIDSCIFENNLKLDQFDALIRAFYGSVSIKNSHFTSNNTGEGCLIHKIVDSLALVENCYFYQVSDAIEFLAVKNNGFIINNYISNIKQPTGDGIDFNGCKYIKIRNNRFIDIIDYGCEIGNDKYGPSENIEIDSNIFINCFRGIVAKGGSSVKAANNIFYKNDIGVKCQFEKWTKIDSPNSIYIVNSLFYNSKTTDFQNNDNSTLKLVNCCFSKKNIDSYCDSIKQKRIIDIDKLITRKQ